MTLGELADLVCQKTHRTDTQSRTEAKAYIKARYQMLWDSRPWRDSLALLTVTAPAEQTLILPPIVGRVLTARWGDVTTLQVEQLGSLFYLDPGIFDTIGQPATFSIAAPSAVSIEPGGQKLRMTSSDPTTEAVVTVRGMLGNNEKTERVTLSGTSVVESVNDYDEVLLLSKGSTSVDLTVTNEDGDTLLFLQTWETFKEHQRLHFHGTPRAADTLLVLYKRKIRPLVEESDGTELTGLDNALLASAIADMLEGQRQYAKAQLKASEASQLAAAAADLETHQSASSIRIIPCDAGFENEGNPATKGYW